MNEEKIMKKILNEFIESDINQTNCVENKLQMTNDVACVMVCDLIKSNLIQNNCLKSKTKYITSM